MAGFQSSADDNSPISEINITPLVDVMLVLLIVFMVAAPMLESGIPIQLPKASSKALLKPEDPVTLHLTKDRRIFLNKTPVKRANLTRVLKNFFKKKQDKAIFVRADGSLPYAVVAKAMATIKSAGIHKIGLVTLPPDTTKN